MEQLKKRKKEYTILKTYRTMAQNYFLRVTFQFQNYSALV